MGTLGFFLIGLIAGNHAVAAPAVQLAVYAPNGVPAPGDVAELVVVVHRSGAGQSEPVPTLEVDGVALEQLPRAIGGGRWAFTLPAAGPKARRIEATAGATRITRLLGPASLPAARLRVPDELQAEVGEALGFEVSSARGEPPLPDQIGVLGSDGRLIDVQQREGGVLQVRWQPGPSPFPRALALGVVDLRSPQVPPAWTVASLRGRPQVPIQTEPGAKVTVIVGGRASEVQVAGEDGLVTMRPEVRPGETMAVVLTEDALGNTQRSDIALGGDARPVLTVVSSGAIVPGRRMPHIYVHASRAGGRPWTAEPPSCRTTRGGPMLLATLGPGRWRAQLPPEIGSLDARVQCDLGSRVQTRTQVRVEGGLPTRLSLRSHPTILTADLPSAEIQAFLENALGDRLPSQGIDLRADRGELRSVEMGDPALVRAVYRGDRAVDAGKDTIRAGVILPAGSGGVWSLDVATAAPQGRKTILIDGRALDRHGRPLSGVPLSLRIPGMSVDATTGERGWASVEVPWPRRSDVVVVEVAGGGLVRRAAVLPGDPVAWDIGGPDLTAALSLPIRAGRIDGLRLSASPRMVESGGSTTRIEVRLEDRAGKTVPDQEIELTASVGKLGTVERQEDGHFVAIYAPPVGVLRGDARIQARTPDGRFSATIDIAIVPRRLRQAIGIVWGFLSAPGNTTEPYVALEYDHRLPWPPFLLRGSIGYTARHAQDVDEITGGTSEIELRNLPIGVGFLVRQDGKRVPSWLGASLVGAVQRVSSRLDDVTIGDGYQVAPPGFQVVAGAGWRLRRGELQAQLGYLFVYGQPGAVGWAGPIGGVVGTLGYKVLY